MTRRHDPSHGDQGASLILAMIIVTVIAVVMSAVLFQNDTNVRATIGLQDQAASNYGADGATNAVLNALKTSSLNCMNLSAPATLTLGNTTGNPFYSPAQSPRGPLNAYAQCAVDSVNGKQSSTSTPPPSTTVSTVSPAPVTSTGIALGAGDPTLPSYAILTTGGASGDFGLDISTSANNKTVCVEDGSIGSNSNINATGETLAARLGSSSTSSDCTQGSGVSPDGGSKLVITAAGTCSGTFTPTSCTAHAGSVATPTAPPLPASSGPNDPAPTCQTSGGTTYAAFVPGHYTTAAKFNNPCGTGSNVFEWLSPGNYLLDFSGATTWTWPSTMIAGTPITSAGASVSPLDPANGSTLGNLKNTAAAPNACADPASGSVNGVQLVFAGASNVSAPLGSSSEICASSRSDAPPVAMYGLASSATVGSVNLPGETMCTASGCGTNTLISTVTDNNSAQAQIFVKGFVYAPNAQLIMTVKNSPGDLFNWGIVIRNFRLSVNGSSPPDPYVQLPRPSTGVGTVVTTSTPPPYPSTSVTSPPPTTVTWYTVRYIDVWTCTVASLQASGATKCPSSGTPNVEVRALVDQNGQLAKILSWNHIR